MSGYLEFGSDCTSRECRYTIDSTKFKMKFGWRLKHADFASGPEEAIR